MGIKKLLGILYRSYFLAQQADLHGKKMFITQNTLPCGVWNMEICLVLNLTMGGKLAVTWPPKIATRYVSFATPLNTK